MIKPDPVKAAHYASLQHAGQRYNDEVPYTVHLDKAEEVARRFDLNDDEFLCAVRLHDTIEDTRTSYQDIKKRFGEGAAELVYAVTDERGRNREERHQKTYPKIRAAGKRAIALKLVDRIANVEYGLADRSTGKADMYAQEFPEFVAALYNVNHEDDVVGQMWNYLARLLNRSSVLENEYRRQRQVLAEIHKTA